MKALAVVLLSVSMYGQESRPISDFFKQPRTMVELSIVAGTLAFDGYSTEAKRGWNHQYRNPDYDWNPMIRYLPPSRVTTSAVIGLGFAGYVFADYKLRRHKVIRAVGLVGFMAAEAAAIKTNYTDMTLAKNRWRGCVGLLGAPSCPR